MLGRLATDRAVRDRFHRAPSATLRELVASGIELSPVELAALATLDPAALQRFALALDPKIQKAVLATWSEETGDASGGGS